MQVGDAINNLFRAAHVLSVGTYWENLLRMVRSNMGKIVILHNNVEQEAEHLAVAKDIKHRKDSKIKNKIKKQIKIKQGHSLPHVVRRPRGWRPIS